MLVRTEGGSGCSAAAVWGGSQKCQFPHSCPSRLSLPPSPSLSQTPPRRSRLRGTHANGNIRASLVRAQTAFVDLTPARRARLFFVLPVVRSISRSCAPHESAADGQAMRRAESHVSLGGSSVGSCHSSHTNGDGHQRSERSDSDILADLLSRDTHACMHARTHARTHTHTTGLIPTSLSPSTTRCQSTCGRWRRRGSCRGMRFSSLP